MRDPGSGWIQLSVVELYLLWSAMDLGPTPEVLDVLHVGRTRARRAELAEEASRELSARDLGTVGAPARDLAAMLRSLGNPSASLDMRVYGSGAPLFAFAATGSSGAAVAARVGDEVRLGAVRATALASALLGSLTQLPPAANRPANVSVADYEAACAEGAAEGVPGFTRSLHAAGVRAEEVSTFAQALTTRTGGGQLGASGRVRAYSLVNWLDTPEGRYALRRNGAWITLTPADTTRLTSMAEEMLTDVR
ncbi:ESX secretion-associated protein EspG [Actinophytocola glycyrrhizae]|uniref:ESX secretion-associated protein EspG n=1 Tax=Actinophytocola glycyrrhizae TaxID=2044873 RepID=A0ABV9S562_9PSEU